MSGKLYLCATPIGNLDDMTFRVLETLKSVDIIAAEDTRNSIRLLNRFEIHTPMTSYHEYNKIDKAYYLIDQMKNDKNVALITDAGTPAISDPGEDLVRLCMEAGIEVTSLPGPAACITALTLSGLPTRRFCFEGFLPGQDDKKQRKRILEDLAGESRTMVIYEAPHHLKVLIKDLYETLGDRRITVCRELTKKFEDIHPMTLLQAIDFYNENDPRGEYVIVVEGVSFEEKSRASQEAWCEKSISEHMKIYEDKGLSHMDAMKKVAADRGIGKRDVYRQLLEADEQGRE